MRGQEQDEADDGWLGREPLPADPMPIFAAWLDQAFSTREQRNPHAMALATVDPDGTPAVRMVLCKGVEVERGALVFYSNRRSRKGRALAAHPRAAGSFYWFPRERQVRVEGRVAPTRDAESDAYFASRPSEAQLGAWASEQSAPVDARATLLAKLERAAERFGLRPDAVEPGRVPRPPHWGGYRLFIERVELWRGRSGRVHDRALWSRRLVAAGEGFEGGPWVAVRLQP